MKNQFFFTFLLFFIFIKNNQAQVAHELLRDGDKLYQEKKYNEAQKKYEKVIEQNLNKANQGAYNLGNTFYQQGNYEAALKNYTESAPYLEDKNQQAQGFYNQGNAHFQLKQYEKSIEAYKKTLRLNPYDVDAKKNLMAAKKILEQQQNQNQNQQNNQNPKDNKEDPNKQNQKQPQSQNQDKNQEPQKQQKPEQKSEQQQSEQNDKEQKQESKKQQSEQLLRIIAEEEKRVHQKMSQQKKPISPKSKGKDW